MRISSMTARWVDHNPAKLFSLGAACFAGLIVSATAAHVDDAVIIQAASCEAAAYVGAGYYTATVETTDGRVFRIGDTRNSEDLIAKDEAYRLVQRVCTGERVRVGYTRSTHGAPEILIAEIAE